MASGPRFRCRPTRATTLTKDEFTLGGAQPNPELMVKAYHQCAQTINILRAFTTGGYADLVAAAGVEP